MESLLIFLLMGLPVLVEQALDPALATTALGDKRGTRNLECVRMSQEQGHALHPGVIPDVAARRTQDLEDVLLCSRRIMEHGERPARDERILSTLRQSVADIAETAAAVAQADVVWHVDAFYPDPRVASKISVAARTTLAEAGRRVSDRVPLAAAGDLVVLSRLPPKDAYPLACARYFAEGALADGDAFLGIMIVDPRETQLHAGMCARGEWRWLR